MPCSQVLQIIVFLFDEYVFIEDDSRLSDEPMGAHSQSLCGVSPSAFTVWDQTRACLRSRIPNPPSGYEGACTTGGKR